MITTTRRWDQSTPSPYRIPSRCPADRRNARNTTIEATRQRYPLRTDDLAGDPATGFRMPPYLPSLPRSERFSASKLADLLGHKLQGQLNGLLARRSITTIDDYRGMYRTVPMPDHAGRWADDVEYARQRVAGVNPMHLCALDRAPDAGPLLEVASSTLALHDTTLAKVLDRGRLFETDYAVLADPRVQKYAEASGRYLAAPRCLFFVDDADVLRPIAIGLPPDRSCIDARAYGPRDDVWAWRLAKWHAQVADGHVHEAVYHLFETHMVTELIAVCAARRLHPDHPITQLLRPHFEFNLAIDVLARTDMLAPGKAIDLALAAGAAGALNAVRIWFNAGWSWRERSLSRELAARGVADASRLPYYPYREDSLALHTIVSEYVGEVMAPFYRDDADARSDGELAAWLGECASHLPGFPASVATRAELFETLTEIVFRASVQHAAVNNGQFDAYGYVPTSPGAMHAPPPSRRAYTETEAVAALPRGLDAIAQIEMAWVLSEPTHYGLLGIGDAPAFAADLEPRSREAVSTVRRRLLAYQEDIARREEREGARRYGVPYLYLDPRNIERSTGT